MLDTLKEWARLLKRKLKTLYFLSKDSRVPLYLKIFVVVLLAYALSPVDLIPDFIPVIGYLDDLLLLPLGIWLVIKLTPSMLWQENEQLADAQDIHMPKSYIAGAAVILLWIVAAFTMFYCVSLNN